jgi:uncharacterized membrane protein YciS (DUF1049 family)
MSDATQSFEQHAKMVPLFHYVTTPLLVIPLAYFGTQLVDEFSLAALMTFLFALGVVLLGMFVRTFPLGVQDRVIRLEERLRLERLLPADLRSRSDAITTDQLIALRFAPDDELPDLVGRVLAGELKDRKSIKRAVKTWRADHQRI